MIHSLLYLQEFKYSNRQKSFLFFGNKLLLVKAPLLEDTKLTPAAYKELHLYLEEY